MSATDIRPRKCQRHHIVFTTTECTLLWRDKISDNSTMCSTWQRKYGNSTLMAFCEKFAGDDWTYLTKGQQCGKHFLVMISRSRISWRCILSVLRGRGLGEAGGEGAEVHTKGLVSYSAQVWYGVYHSSTLRIYRIVESKYVVRCYHTSVACLIKYRADSRFAPSQWETALLCNDVSHWLGASLESALKYIITSPYQLKSSFNPTNNIYNRLFVNMCHSLAVKAKCTGVPQ